MISSITFWLATTATIITIICYIALLLRFKSPNRSAAFSDLPQLFQDASDELLQETSEIHSTKRKRELLEKIKEERIKEYLEKKRK